MGNTPPDAAGRLAALRTLLPRLEALFRDLVTAGDRHATTQKLGEGLQRLQILLALTTPADADVHAAWDDLAAVIRDALAVDAPPPRGGWWK